MAARVASSGTVLLTAGEVLQTSAQGGPDGRRQRVPTRFGRPGSPGRRALTGANTTEAGRQALPPSRACHVDSLCTVDVMSSDILDARPDADAVQVVLRTCRTVMWVWVVAGFHVGLAASLVVGPSGLLAISGLASLAGAIRQTVWARRLAPQIASWVDRSGPATVGTWLEVAARVGPPVLGPRTLARRVAAVGQLLRVERAVRAMGGLACTAGHWLGCPHLPADVDVLADVWPQAAPTPNR